MKCILNTNEQEDLLLGYTSSTLAPETARTFERHLATCEHCQTMLALQAMVDETLSDWKAPEVTDDFDQRLLARLRAEQAQAQPWWKEFLILQWSWKPLVPLALAALALGVFLWQPNEAPTTAQQVESMQAEEIEQAERALDDMEALRALGQPEATASSQESL
jgi:anti-sigma factor RsiW